MNSNSLLPPGIRISSGRDVEERPAVRIDLAATAVGEARLTACVVVTPREARALGALLIKQADLVDAAERARGPILRVLP